MVGEDENMGYTARLPKKRASGPPQSLQLPTTKKRVALGDLTNSTNLVSNQNSDLEIEKPKRNLTKKKKDREPVKTEIVASFVDSEEFPSTGSTQEFDSEAVAGLDEIQKCAYASSIYKHLHALEMEEKRRPIPNYIKEVQNDISPNMREILVDWLVEVAEEYKLVSDTLYLTISYIDRFLSSHAISRNKLQLLGASCILIASKDEEISPPCVEDLCYITDNTYTEEEVMKMEREVLKFLNFDMGTPTTKTFLRWFTRAAQENCKSPDLQFEFLACYLAELSLLGYRCIMFLPSIVAASAIFLSRFTIQPKKHPWSTALQLYSGYRPSDLKQCVLAIHALQLNRRGSSLHAIQDKYMQDKSANNKASLGFSKEFTGVAQLLVESCSLKLDVINQIFCGA